MVIRNKFNNDEIDVIVDKIFNFIIDEPELTKRSKKHIQSLIENGSFYVAFDRKNNINGFIAKDKLIDKYYELKCWYVFKKYRGTDLSDMLFKAVAVNRDHKYIGTTFQENILTKVKKFGFRKGSYSDIPFKVLLLFLITREWSSIIKHFFKKKSYIFIRL